MNTLASIWAEFGHALTGFVRGRARSPEDAEEILQEVMLRVHRGLPGLDAQAKLGPWLHRIARNAIIDHWRAKSRRPEAEPLPDDPPAPPPPDESASLIQAMEGCLRPILDTLPETYREAVRLADLEGMPQTDLAARLGLSPSGAKSRVQRGRALLRGAFDGCCRLTFDRRGNVVEVVRKEPGTVC